VAFSQRDLAADEAVAATGELNSRRSAGSGLRTAEGRGVRRRRARPALAAPCSSAPVRPASPARRPLLRRRRLGQRQRALRLGLKSDGARERHRRGDDASAGESRERLAQLRRGEASRTCCAPTGATRTPPTRSLAALRRQTRRIPVAEGRRSSFNTTMRSRASRRRIARVSIYGRRATQIDDRDQRRWRLCAGDAARAPPPSTITPTPTTAASASTKASTRRR